MQALDFFTRAIHAFGCRIAAPTSNDRALRKPRIRHARGGEHIDAGGAGLAQGESASIGGGAGGHDVVNQQDRKAGKLGFADLDRVGQLVPAGLESQGTERDGGASACESIRPDRFAGNAGQGASEQSGLVVAALAQPRDMQGHGDEDVGTVEQGAASLGHQQSEAAGMFGAVGIFEGQDEVFGHAVIMQGGAGLREGWG